MKHEVYATEKMRCVLTTDSPASSYGIPALRVEGEGAEDAMDCGPADMVEIAGQPVFAAALVALWGMSKGRTKDEREAAAAFCQQWPDGMQVV